MYPIIFSENILPLGMTPRKQTTRTIDFMSDNAKRAKAESDKILLFYSFRCPYCNEVNVSAKEYKREVVLCSHSGCRRVIVIENFKDIA